MKHNAPRIAGLAIVCAVTAPATAQDNALSSAADAFGERAGIEQSGLYSETQVRGFDLNDSGAYRINDAYFNRAAILDDTVLSSTSVRVGVNAARLAYPAPSGVVNYRLREAGPTNELRVGAGVRDFGTRVVQTDGSYRNGSFSFAGGFLWRQMQRYSQGYEGAGSSIGGVAAWELASEQRLRAFASRYQRHYDGDYALAAIGGAMPPPLRRLHQYSPNWAETSAVSTNMGVLYDARLGDFDVDASVFRSIFDIRQNDFTFILADGAGNATATMRRNPRRVKTADSAEVRIARAFDAGAFDQQLSVSLRGARTTSELASQLVIPLGAFKLPEEPPEGTPARWDGTRGDDRSKQITVSAGYTLAWNERFQLRLGAHRVRYDKAVLSVAGAQSRRVSESTHYNASAIFNVTERGALFGSWVTGLEESGTAPASARNNDEVLPPSETRQVELGLRYALSPRLTFIGALFDVSKPSQGLRRDDTFGLTGQVRHRGVEASISGQLNDRTKLVVGVVDFDSDVTGPLVDAGIVGRHGVGVSQRAAAASIEYQLRDGWSIDANLNYSGKRWVDTANTFTAPAFTTLSLGLRRNFKLADRPAALRVLASNLTNVEGYTAARSGLLSPIGPLTIRAMLTLNFGAGK